MLQGELWARRLATEVGIDLETSLQIWSALVLQLKIRLGSGQRINLSDLGIWGRYLQPEYILVTNEGELLMPPRLQLSIDLDPSSPSIPFTSLAPALELETEIRSVVITSWLESIPKLCMTLLVSGSEVHWPGLGIWMLTVQGIRFCLSEDFADELNKPFSSFRPEVFGGGNEDGLQRVIGEPQVMLLEARMITLPCRQTASPPSTNVATHVATSIAEPEIPSAKLEISGQLGKDVGGDDTEATITRPRCFSGLIILLVLAVAIFIVMRMLSGQKEPGYPHGKLPEQKDSYIRDNSRERESKVLDTTILPDTTDVVAQVETSMPQAPEAIDTVLATQTRQHTGQSKKIVKGLEASLPANANEAEVVVLSADESLALLAQRKYGHRAFWVYIYEENREYLPDPHNIPIGTRLQLPPASKYGIDPKNTKSLQQALVLSKTIQ